MGGGGGGRPWPYHPQVTPRPSSIALVLALGAGCDRLDAVGVVVDPPCEGQVPRQLYPREASAAWVGGPVFADLSCPDEAAGLVVEAGGVEVDGAVEVAHGGRQVRFVPTDRLAPETVHEARLETETGDVTWQFTTSGLGEPVGGDLDGRALALSPSRAGVLEPAGLAEGLLELLREQVHPVIQFQAAADGAQVPVRLGARADEPAASPQSTAVETMDLTGGWSDPLWSVSGLTLRYPGPSGEVVFENVAWSGALGPGASSGGGGVFRANWDLRDVADVLSGDGVDACDRHIDAGGAGCLPCSDGEPWCVAVDLRDVPGEAWAFLL